MLEFWQELDGSLRFFLLMIPYVSIMGFFVGRGMVDWMCEEKPPTKIIIVGDKRHARKHR